jgi:hypothetical protein
MRVIPPEAWSGLAVFDPEKLLALQMRSDKADPWDKDYEQLQTEIEQFLNEFKAFAKPLLVERRRQNLRELCEWRQGSLFSAHKNLKTLQELGHVDLTPAELMRLARQKNTNGIGTTMSELARALAALEPGRKHIDNRPDRAPGRRAK